MNRPWHIYGLCSPRTGEIRYVGFSFNPSQRLKSHLSYARKDTPPYPVHRWIKAMLAKNSGPILRILESGVDQDGWQEAERRWIQHYESTNLLNAAPGGLAFPKATPEAWERAKEKLRNRVFTPEHRARISLAKTGVPRSDREAVVYRLRAVSAGNAGKKMILSDAERSRRREAGKIAGHVNGSRMWASITDSERERRSEMARQQMRRVWAERRAAGVT